VRPEHCRRVVLTAHCRRTSRRPTGRSRWKRQRGHHCS
jgi:hypothetical protein